MSNGVWEIGAPTTGPGSAHSGSSVAGTVLDGNHPRNTDSRLISPQINLPEAASGEEIVLKFWQWFSYRSGSYDNDEGHIHIQTYDDATGEWSDWTDLGRFAYLSSSVWSPAQVDLTSYSGQVVRIAFYHQDYYSSNYYGAGGESAGWYIDDVEVKKQTIQYFSGLNDFESGWDGWSVSNGVWEIGAPTTGPGSAHSGSSVAGTILGGNYPRNTDSRLISPQINLPEAASGEEIVLRFWQWFSYRSGSYDNDEGHIHIQTYDDATGEWSDWTDLGRFAYLSSSVWSPAQVDLTSYSGQVVRIAFYHQDYYSSNYYGAGGEYAGWYIDDVRIVDETTPPEEITNLHIDSFEDSVILQWSSSPDTDGDLVEYRLYFNNATTPVVLSKETISYEVTDLTPASAYPVRITAVDGNDNESAGVTTMAATSLPNPTGLTATPAGSMMDLAWNSVAIPDLVSQYTIYVSETDFTSVSGMTPKLRVNGTQTSTRLAGLEEDTLYYFAVTAINLSGNDRKTVTTVSATTESDPDGPEISDIRFNGEPLTDGMTITVSGTLSLTATDISKVSRVQFYDDANLLGQDQNGSSSYAMPWFIEPVADGTHTLTFTAYDTLDHSTTVTRTVNVTLAPPLAPVITSPATATTTAESSLIVTGQSQVQNEIALLINGGEPDQWTVVNSDGGFSIPATLVEGENRIQAQARNRAGNSPLSEEVVVILNTDQPQTPLHLAAESQEAGAIRLSWSRPLETAVAGYNIYRSATAFDSIATAEKINPESVIGTVYIDLPDTDGTYYYGVTTVDLQDRESGLSTIVSAVSDRIMPAAVTIAYTPTGPYDPDSGRVGPGTVDVLLTVSETLAAVPFFSLNPTGGWPMTLDMVKTDDLTYAGAIDITADTPSGTSYAVFSGRDIAGNRGTEIQEGTSLLIDTQAPQVIDIGLVPASPIRNDADNPVSITATIGLDEALKTDTVPELTYRLSGHGETVFAVDTISQVDTITGHAQTWQVILTLPADAGETQAETLRFVYNGLDDLGNAGGSISVANQFQIYQDDLPPLDAPTGLSVQSLAGGQIALTWNSVDGAAAYALYRQAPGESELTLLTEIEGETAYTDAPALEGVYHYAVASIRRANDQETVSGLSDAVTAISDATAPAAPSDLTLALTAQGVVAEWADNAAELATFSLFRSDQSSIPSVDGLTPVMTGILDTRAVDAYPQPTFHCYTVVAVDSAGNTSKPAPSMVLDFDLLPVSSLSVHQEDEDPPVVTWSHADATVTGYDFYLGPEATAVKVNTDPMTATTFTDTGYNGDERHYGVVALGNAGQESLQRRITLPLLQASLDENAVLLRGAANRLDYIVENRSTAAIDNVTLILPDRGCRLSFRSVQCGRILHRQCVDDSGRRSGLAGSDLIDDHP